MRALLMAAAALALVACGQTTTVSEPAPEPVTDAVTAPMTAAEATAQDTCGAAGYRALVGSNFAAVTLPAESGIRIIQPNTPVTEDFRADRLNVIVDANGLITGLECY